MPSRVLSNCIRSSWVTLSGYNRDAACMSDPRGRNASPFFTHHKYGYGLSTGTDSSQTFITPHPRRPGRVSKQSPQRRVWWVSRLIQRQPDRAVPPELRTSSFRKRLITPIRFFLANLKALRMLRFPFLITAI